VLYFAAGTTSGAVAPVLAGVVVKGPGPGDAGLGRDAATEIYAEPGVIVPKCRQRNSARASSSAGRMPKKIASDVVIMAFKAPVQKTARGQWGH
jgi:hypothetical protein